MSDVYQIITDKIIKRITEENSLPWKKPWKKGVGGGLPVNGISMKPYSGINVFMLGFSPNASSKYWFTFKQASELGGMVKKGSKGEMVCFWSPFKKVEKDANGMDKERTHFVFRYYTVFNLGQIEFPETVLAKYTEKVEESKFTPIEQAEKVMENFKDLHGKLNHGGDKAYYSPSFDMVQMPNKEAFDTNEHYYSTLFHETVHFTGAESRLNRFKANEGVIFGDNKYSKEELVAEIGASMLNAIVGIESTFDNSVAYIQNWLSKLKNDNKLIVIAANQATKAVNYIIGEQDTEVIGE